MGKFYNNFTPKESQSVPEVYSLPVSRGLKLSTSDYTVKTYPRLLIRGGTLRGGLQRSTQSLKGRERTTGELTLDGPLSWYDIRKNKNHGSYVVDCVSSTSHL